MKDYVFIIIPFISLILCQIIKFTIESIRKKKIFIGRLFNGAGGMPSTHTSFCFALVFTIGYRVGFTTPLFAMSLIFSLIVAYDAIGVRMESGRQAEAINKIVADVFRNKPSISIKHLKEQLGHYPVEVIVGIFFAFCVSTICNFYIFV